MYPLTLGLAISNRALWDEIQAAIQPLGLRVVLESAGVGDPAAFLEKLSYSHPDVLFLDLTDLDGSLPGLLRQIKALAEPPDVVAVHSSQDGETILAAIRAGAAEYLYPPLTPSLREALERIGESREQRRQPDNVAGKTVGFLSAKGGCGATTLACHVTLELQRKTGKHVLLMDLDTEASSVRLLVKTKARYSIFDALANVQRLDASYWKGLVSNGIPGVEVLGAPLDLYPRDLSGAQQVRHVLRFVRSQYGFAVADLGRGCSPFLFGALEELDELFLVITFEVPALRHAKQLIECLERKGFPKNRLRLVLNRATKRSEVTPEELETMVSHPIHTIIPNNYQELYEPIQRGRCFPRAALSTVTSRGWRPE
jgi:pilus assembly protein CpaE